MASLNIPSSWSNSGEIRSNSAQHAQQERVSSPSALNSFSSDIRSVKMAPETTPSNMESLLEKANLEQQLRLSEKVASGRLKELEEQKLHLAKLEEALEQQMQLKKQQGEQTPLSKTEASEYYFKSGGSASLVTDEEIDEPIDVRRFSSETESGSVKKVVNLGSPTLKRNSSKKGKLELKL